MAQLVDSSLGMGFGTLSSASLLALGAPPLSASATVHAAEVLTSGASVLSHWRLRSIDWALLRALAPGAIMGAGVGAVLLQWVPGEGLRPYLGLWFVLLGGVVVFKAVRSTTIGRWPRLPVRVVGFAGGFVDAFGGAGWGEVASSGLILRGEPVRRIVGALNTVEWLVTVVVSVVLAGSAEAWDPLPVIALAAGGTFAAPVGAFLSQRLPARPLTLVLGLVVAALGAWTFASSPNSP